jgi:hypothetical protein
MMKIINAQSEKSEVLAIQDGGTYSEHCDEYMDPSSFSSSSSSSSSSALQLFMSFGLLNYFFPLFPLLRLLSPLFRSHPS